MWNIILWLVFGALVGWIASIIMGTNARQGWLMNIIVGIVGALLGGWLFDAFTPGEVAVTNNILDPVSVIVALVGAIVLIAIVGALFPRRCAPGEC